MSPSHDVQFGIATVRGCEVEGLLDDRGHLIEDAEDLGKFKSDDRTIRVWLDTNQYQQDMVGQYSRLIVSSLPL